MSDLSTPLSRAPRRYDLTPKPLAAALLLIALGAVYLAQTVSGRQAALYIVGALMFGGGMQLGGGCASGTLYTVGGGSTRMIVTLAAFVTGSVVATAHMPFWTALPALKPLSMVNTLGAGAAIALN